MSPSRRVIGSRVIQRKVLGSANPIAKGFREGKKGCMDSIGGVVVGFILFLFAFVPVWSSVKGVAETSKDVAALTLQAPDQVEGTSGLVMIHGGPEGVEAIQSPLDCEDIDDQTDLFWYHAVRKEFTRHTEPQERTVTRIENGEEVEETIQEDVEVTDWEEMSNEEKTAPFSLGNIEIDPDSADVRLDDSTHCEDKGRERIGQEWITLDYILADGLDDVYVVGNLSGDRIGSGSPFIITDKRPEELVQSLKTKEKTDRVFLTIVSIFLFFIAFNLLIGPLLFVLNYVPLIGPALRGLIAFISLILAIVLVLLMQVIFKFWWLLIILLIVVIALLVIFGKKKGGHKHPAESPKEEPGPAEPAPSAPPAQPVAPAQPEQHKFCSECGTRVEPGEKFCKGCGKPSS
jgi:hypothetical protein